MKKLWLAFVVGIAGVACAIDPAAMFKEAESLYGAGDQEGARALYESAAEKGLADAHFALAYQYVLPREESRKHYVAAASQGHEQALEYALDDLLFRANGLRWAQPRQAWKLYQQAKHENPQLTLYEEVSCVELMKMCAELPQFDADGFCEKYELDPDLGENTPYAIWELAEEASRGGQFGKPDPVLVFQLVVRGASVPAEFEYAARDCYANWKAGTCREFNIADYVTSGMGQGYCAEREHKRVEAQLNARLDALAEKLSPDAAKLLVPARYAAFYFIECNAVNAEGHGGSGQVAWVLGSVMDQKTKYVDLVEKAATGFEPEQDASFAEAEQRMQELFWEIIEILRNKEPDDFSGLPRPALVNESQRVWWKHLEATSSCLHAINPLVPQNHWKEMLIQQRIRQLAELKEQIAELI